MLDLLLSFPVLLSRRGDLHQSIQMTYTDCNVEYRNDLL